jgi:opacity protein-like surface antigen
MKKLLPAAFMLAALPLSVFADDAAPNRDAYIGLKIHKNSSMAIDASLSGGRHLFEYKAKPSGIGLNYGQKIGDYVRIEGELGYGGGIKIQGIGETDTFMTGSAMLNGYLEYEVVKGFKPYVGVGLGAGLINGELDAYGYNINMSDSALTLSYQIMLGTSIELSDRFDLNFGFKYQDYGQLKIENQSYKFKFDVDATEFYAGFAYKFSWK